jgi:prepilin-type N-terminal cleavage/methylation domain-containing protein
MKRRQFRRGMTLMESMASMAILTIGISGAIGISVDSSRAVNRSAHVQEATMLAQSLVSALLTVPWSAVGAGGASLFANTSSTNDPNVADVEVSGTIPAFKQATVPLGAYDHCSETVNPPSVLSQCVGEITGTPTAAIVTPLPTGRTNYERYWNIAPITGTNGVVIAVIVRWHEGSSWSRVVLLATRYQP